MLFRIISHETRTVNRTFLIKKLKRRHRKTFEIPVQFLRRKHDCISADNYVENRIGNRRRSCQRVQNPPSDENLLHNEFDRVLTRTYSSPAGFRSRLSKHLVRLIFLRFYFFFFFLSLLLLEKQRNYFQRR